MGRDWKRRATADNPVARVPTRRALVLFDMDGTLIDGAAFISEIMVQAFLAAGQDAPTPQQVRRTIGMSLPEMIDALAPTLDSDVRAKILNGYRLRYFDEFEAEDMLPEYAGASDVLAELSGRGYAMGIATGRARRSTRHILSTMGWTRHFHTIQCADNNPSKPAPGMVLHAMAETGCRAGDTLMIGDSCYDMQMAQAAGVRAVGVDWGYAPVDVLLAQGATAIARTFDELVEIVTRLVAEVDEAGC